MTEQQQVQVGVWAVERDNLTKAISDLRTEYSVVALRCAEKVTELTDLRVEEAGLIARIEALKESEKQHKSTVTTELSSKAALLSQVETRYSEKLIEERKLDTSIDTKTHRLSEITKLFDSLFESYRALSSSIDTTKENLSDVLPKLVSQVREAASETQKVVTKIISSAQTLAQKNVEADGRLNSIKAREASVKALTKNPK